MKRKYKKPILAVESFQLDALVAASCSSTVLQADTACPHGTAIGYSENSCGNGTGKDAKWYYYNYDNCDIDLSYADGNDTVCYHGPTLAGTVFVNS